MPLSSKVQTLPAIELLLHYLEAEGVEYIFGIPGGPLMPLYEAIFERRRIRSILTKHEEGAAFMADGYARVRGGLGVCCTTTGPGSTNALTGVACAYMDSIPILILTAQVAIGAFGKGAAQESSVHGVDVVELYKPVTKASLMLLSSEKMSEMVRFVLRTALSGRTGPVHLNLPANMMKRSVPLDLQPPQSYRADFHHFDREAVKKACCRLIQARRPAMLVGHGAYLSHAWDQVRQLAEKLRIPVATTPKAKGVFPESHLLSFGVLGFAGSPQADTYFRSGEVDVLLTVGTSLGELATSTWSPKLKPREELIQIDADPREIGKNYPATIGVVGDARTVLTEMLYQMERELRWRQPQELEKREEWIREFKSKTPRFVETRGFEDLSLPLKPQRLMRELQEALPQRAHLFVDIGNVMAWAFHFFTVTEPGTFHINLGFASMGHAVGAAIGGKLAAPEAPVLALVGDAAFAMNGMEVHTAVEHDIPVIWLVMNNGGHGMVCHGEQLMYKGKFSAGGRFRRPLDIAQMAEAMGALALRVERPGELAEALSRALISGRPTVIDALVDPEEMPPLSLRVETLDRFFEGSS
ncbi:MAG: thiamine pyrophosphate-binding protein [Elusimicrobia bacterium]|nr:thiamine pyrophosphate-binding protein [Elusimicrobiota bacterium]